MREIYTLIFFCVLYLDVFAHGGTSLPNPYEGIASRHKSAQDTIPIKPRYGNFVEEEKKNPFDITPSIIEQKVEYDPKSGNYIIYEKIGDEYFRTPSYMTFNEYLEWKSKQEEKAYFNKLAGVNTGKKDRKVTLNPLTKVDIQKNLVDRLFGGSEVNIQPQGNIDLTFGLDYYRNENPNIPLRQQSPGVLFDFDMDIEMSVDGNIGEKLNLDFNYDTQATFDFDRQIKLGYDSEQFGEDDIIKKIEAGNVSLPLRSNLIQGNQNLFGLKTELQFGHLRITALASQQRSERNNLRIENGAATQRFELRPDDYDENRHFFLSHFNRNTYESSLQNIPYIGTSFRISRIEVWISEDRTDYQQGSKIIAAIADLAEPVVEKFTNRNPTGYLPPNIQDPLLLGADGEILADNRANPLYDQLIRNNDIDDIDKTSTLLKRNYNMQQTTDFEVFRGRRLTPSEFSYNEQLGTISLNIRLRPNQVLGVAYQYYYIANCDEVYQVGDMSSEGEGNTEVNSVLGQELESPNLTFVKLLKSTNQRTDISTWDLMMKNVYPLNASNVSQEDFEFDIFFENDRDGSLIKFLPFEGLRNRPLLDVFNLDNVNTVMDPQPDGIFDYIPGITVIPRSGSVVFPVLEPFGKSLRNLLPAEIADSLVYTELYDTTLVGARETLEKNKFVMLAKVKSDFSGEINLGPFVPRGSVRVTAGGRRLVEDQDYVIDYSLGRLRIINPAYLQQGTRVNVSFEDNALFNLQQKTMLGLRAEYELSDKLSLGGTYLRLFERPFTQKVNLGNDPINNRIFGLDLNYSTEAPTLTKLVDRLPFYSTKAESFINFSAEVAALKPGHSGAINLSDDNSGVVNIDDFEGTINGLLLGTTRTNDWVLASTPAGRPEADLNSLEYGANRALLNWYVIDNAARGNAESRTHSYSRIIQQDELFMRQTQPGLNVLYTFDLSYYPKERGPYNFDLPNGTPYSAGVSLNGDGTDLVLNEPESRWGGIMRYFSNTDFQAANYESIEFWMLNPFMERLDGEQHVDSELGKMVFQLGSVSEDVLNDNRQFYENSIPVDTAQMDNLVNTVWGRVSNIVPVVDGFDQVDGAVQDLGFDGLNDRQEALKFNNWLTAVGNAFFIPQAVFEDPAKDNYLYFNSQEYDQNLDIVSRYKNFNNPQGNAPLTSRGQGNNQERLRGNPRPDKEDLNNNKSLDEAEAYYEYELPIINNSGFIDESASEYIREQRTITNQNGQEETWYRVRIPLNDGDAINGIQGFRSIQFMRMFVTGYSSAKTFRLAEFQLRRNQWRLYPKSCVGDASQNFDFVLDDVGVFENSSKTPFQYLTPRGIQQEQVFSTFANLLQDEKSMQINYCDMGYQCEGSLYKLSQLDLTFYKKLQMFVHAERDPSDPQLESGDMSLFVRLGKDFKRNYYEYEMPLVMSNDIQGRRAQETVWPDTNYIDFELAILKDLKLLRKQAGLGQLDSFQIEDPNNSRAIRKIVGNPSLGYIKVIQIGVRNRDREDRIPHCGEVWVNELRASGLEQKGGYAGIARLQMKMADLGEINASGSYSSIGWGAIDQSLQERAREEVIQYDLSTNLELGKFFPNSLGLSIPFYAQYSKVQSTPQFDPFQLDLSTEEAQELVDTPAEKQEIADRAKETSTIKAFNFTNVKKTSSGGGAKKPWSLDNFSVSYAYSETVDTDPIIRENKVTETSAGLDYNYNRSVKYWEPFKGIKSSILKIVKEFNLNLLPNSFRFSTTLDRFNNSRTFRIPETPEFTFDNKRFLWDRRYDLQWDLTKALNIDFTATSSSMIDELRQVGIADQAENRDWVNETGQDFTARVREDQQVVRDYWWNNFKGLGRAKNYDHQLKVDYNLPIRHLPLLDWVNLKAVYTADYAWQAAPLIVIDEQGRGPGNIIRNSQSKSLVGTFSFDKLYEKWDYLKRIESGNSGNRSTRTRRTSRRTPGNNNSQSTANSDSKDEEKVARNPSIMERVLIRPLLSLRDIRITYRENLETLLPGFDPEATLLGLSRGFEAPGLGFVFGGQPDINRGNANNWLFRAADRGWFNTSPNINDQLSQLASHNLDIQMSLELFKDFNIDLDFKKTYRRTHTEVFKNKNATGDPEFMQLAGYDVGSFEETYFAMNTLFGNPPEALYRIFKDNRRVISNRLPNINNAEEHPSDPGYAQGYGERNYDVIVPAFLAAYEGVDVNTVDLDLENKLSNRLRIPAPQWTLRYDGLSKLPIFKDILSGFSLTHSYRSTIKVNQFNSIPNFDATDPFAEFDSGDNYYTRLEIPAMSISEQFAPLLGLNFKTKNDMNFDLQYKKGRQLDLALQTDLRESRSTEFVLGFGYTINNFNGFFGGGKSAKSRKTQEEETDENTNSRSRRNRGRVSSSRGKTLKMNLDFSIRDNISYVFNFLDSANDPQPERGVREISINPNIDYDVNENLTLRFFTQYRKSEPKTTLSFTTTNINGGVTLRFKLN